MNIDVVLTSKPAAAAARVLTAATAQQLIQQIRAALGPAGRIDRLRIVDSFDGPASSHPLRSLPDLALLRPLFSPQGSVEIVPGPVGVPFAPSGLPTVAGQQGMQGFIGGGKMISSVANNAALHVQLSATFGVPVRPGRT